MIIRQRLRRNDLERNPPISHRVESSASPVGTSYLSSLRYSIHRSYTRYRYTRYRYQWLESAGLDKGRSSMSSGAAMLLIWNFNLFTIYQVITTLSLPPYSTSEPDHLAPSIRTSEIHRIGTAPVPRHKRIGAASEPAADRGDWRTQRHRSSQAWSKNGGRGRRSCGSSVEAGRNPISFGPCE